MGSMTRKHASYSGLPGCLPNLGQQCKALCCQSPEHCMMIIALQEALGQSHPSGAPFPTGALCDSSVPLPCSWTNTCLHVVAICLARSCGTKLEKLPLCNLMSQRALLSTAMQPAGQPFCRSLHTAQPSAQPQLWLLCWWGWACRLRAWGALSCSRWPSMTASWSGS